MFSSFPIPDDPRIRSLFEGARGQVERLGYSERYLEMKKVRDQLEGGRVALGAPYHEAPKGMSEDQRKRWDRSRAHVNLAQPALDRLVNSIHSGRIRRRILDPEVQALLKRPEHVKAMVALCESAFCYGTGYLVPIARELPGGRRLIRYWHPNPMTTVVVTNPLDVSEVLGVIELVMRPDSLTPVGARFVTAGAEGSWDLKGPPVVLEHDWGFLPCVIATGRSQDHLGTPYGRSLIVAAADASIKVTNNQANLELLRDQQTQALLVIVGEPTSTSAENKEANQKYLVFDKEGSSAEYKQPQVQIEQVIKLTQRFATDAAVSSGLPVDTFLPELIAGSDASATAARQRAFPLTQRMARLVTEWGLVEARCAAVIAGLVERQRTALVVDLEDLAERAGVEISIWPNVAESEAETLSNWQQQTEKFFRPIEEAIEYYAAHLSDEQKGSLAAKWREKFDPDGTDEKAREAFLRDVVKSFLADGTVADVGANLTDLRALWDGAGLPREAGYEEPFLPVVSDAGPLVTGEVVRDAEGAIVGGVAGAAVTGAAAGGS
ncbi:hypothetical protein GC173_08090 [bacterium]|nr:hypothetical protein [bacterium]